MSTATHASRIGHEALEMPGAPGAPPERTAISKSKQSRKFSLANWRVPSRLVLLIFIPTAVAVLLGGLRVANSISSAAEYQRVGEVVELVASLDNLTHELQLERDLTARFIAGGRRGAFELDLIRSQQESVNTVAAQVQSRADVVAEAFGELGRQRLAQLRARLGKLKTLRETVIDSQLPALPAIEKYSLLMADMLRLYDGTGQAGFDEQLGTSITALASLARAKEETSKQRALLAVGLARQSFAPAELDAFSAAQSRQDSALDAFFASAVPAQRQIFSDTVTGTKIDRAEFLKARAFDLAKNGQALRRLDARGNDATRWFDASSDAIDKMQAVEKALVASIISRSGTLQQSDRNAAAVSVSLVVAVILLVLLITAAVARSLVRPLRRLRTEALEIAGNRLPDMVQRLRESNGTEGDPEIRPIGVASTDEVGEVARAFDEVHREAIRLAGDEAKLRSNVSAMFVNLSRRTQTLVERQITLIDGLEQGEQDEERLGNLFKLDHLATRMRRNSENLLVLAGQEPARKWSQPVEITDVVRASLSEVEGYERVVLNFAADIAIAGQAVNDVIHLLAELVENALSFSARDTRVIVSGNRIDGGGVMVSITDAGIGMTAEEVAQANWRLAHPPVVDVSVSRRMGLFVVGRLALRNGIRVQIRPHDSGGLTAMVLLPESIMGTQALPPQPFNGAFAPVRSQQPDQLPWNPAPLAIANGREDIHSRVRSQRHESDAEATGPLPVVRASIEEPAAEEFLPIYASVESAWFQKTPTPEAQPGWEQPGATDAGWRAAAAAAKEPAWEGNTSAGLPKRIPKANLVPGSADAGRSPVVAPPPALSPDRARSRLTSLQQGVRQARAVARGELSGDQGYPGVRNENEHDRSSQ